MAGRPYPAQVRLSQRSPSPLSKPETTAGAETRLLRAVTREETPALRDTAIEDAERATAPDFS